VTSQGCFGNVKLIFGFNWPTSNGWKSSGHVLCTKQKVGSVSKKALHFNFKQKFQIWKFPFSDILILFKSNIQKCSSTWLTKNKITITPPYWPFPHSSKYVQSVAPAAGCGRHIHTSYCMSFWPHWPWLIAIDCWNVGKACSVFILSKIKLHVHVALSKLSNIQK